MSVNHVPSSTDPEPQPRSTETVIELFEACLELAALRARRQLDHYRLHGIVPKKSDSQIPSPLVDAPPSTCTLGTSSTTDDAQTAIP